jgi:hypothetical protein
MPCSADVFDELRLDDISGAACDRSAIGPVSLFLLLSRLSASKCQCVSSVFEEGGGVKVTVAR